MRSVLLFASSILLCFIQCRSIYSRIISSNVIIRKTRPTINLIKEKWEKFKGDPNQFQLRRLWRQRIWLAQAAATLAIGYSKRIYTGPNTLVIIERLQTKRTTLKPNTLSEVQRNLTRISGVHISQESKIVLRWLWILLRPWWWWPTGFPSSFTKTLKPANSKENNGEYTLIIIHS